jgi:hypothetical protein
MHLWNHVSPPPAQNTLIVMNDGRVIEGNLFPHEALYGPDVHRIFVGGYDWRCDKDEDPFSFNALGVAGYSCCHPLQDIYDPSDNYSVSDEYVEKGSC